MNLNHKESPQRPRSGPWPSLVPSPIILDLGLDLALALDLGLTLTYYVALSLDSIVDLDFVDFWGLELSFYF